MHEMCRLVSGGRIEESRKPAAEADGGYGGHVHWEVKIRFPVSRRSLFWESVDEFCRLPLTPMEHGKKKNGLAEVPEERFVLKYYGEEQESTVYQ